MLKESAKIHAQYDWTTGVPDNGNEWRKFRAVPRFKSLVPLASPLFSTSSTRGGNRSAFRLPGAGGGSFPLYGGTFAWSYSVSIKVIWSLRVESPKRVPRTVQALLCTGRNSPKHSFAPCKRLFWESHSGGPETPFALSLITFGHFGCFDTCTRPAGSKGSKPLLLEEFRLRQGRAMSPFSCLSCQGVAGAPAGAPAQVSGGFTLAEVAKHNTKTDCWVVLSDRVLNVTSFLSEHPGGELAILTFAGKDESRVVLVEAKYGGLYWDWVGGKTLFLCVCFNGHFLWGRKRHIKQISRKSRDP